MGKAAGVSRRRKKVATKRYTRSKQLKRVRLRELKKTGGIKDDVIRDAWDTKKSLRGNLANMGLSHDPNKLMAKEEREKTKQQLQKRTIQSTTTKLHQQLLRQKQRQEAKRARKASGGDAFSVETMSPEESKKKSVADKLAEQVAATPAAKNFRFGPDNVKFCAYMIEKYGDDYQAMVRDKMNRYQESAGQIRAKIKRFLTIPEHQRVFLKAKELVEANLVDDEEEDSDQ